MKYIVLNSEDVYEALQGEDNEDLRDAFETILRMVAMYREAQGKKQNDYLVINKDEPYANEVIEIMDKHGHWEGEVRKAYVLKEKTGRYRCHNIFVENEEYYRNVANALMFHSKKRAEMQARVTNRAFGEDFLKVIEVIVSTHGF